MLKKIKNNSPAYHPRPLGRGLPGGNDKIIKKIIISSTIVAGSKLFFVKKRFGQ